MSHSIAIDLGGTIIKVGLLKEGHLVDHLEIDAHAATGLQSELPELEEAVDYLLHLHQLKNKDILGIGFSFAGLVDSLTSRILSTNHKYDDGPQTDLIAWARKKWNCPLMAENDARMALLGEWQYGAGKGHSDIVLVTMGTGIGSAVLMEGKLLRGAHFQAGNLGGHLVVDHQGSLCTCGNIGCVEAEASTWRLPSLLKEHPGFLQSAMNHEKVLDFKALFYHAQHNDKVALEVLDHCLSVWTGGIISMIHAFDPEMVILSGGIMKSSSVILPFLQQKVNTRAWTPWGKVTLVQALHPDAAALYGADYLVRSTIKLNP